MSTLQPRPQQNPAPAETANAIPRQLDHSAGPAAAFIANLDGELTGYSSAFAQLADSSIDKFAGYKVAALFSQAAPSPHNPVNLWEAILTGSGSSTGYRADLLLQGSDGKEIAVQLSATLMRDSAAHPIAVLGVLHPPDQNSGVSSAAESLAPGLSSRAIVSRKIDDAVFILASPVMHKFIDLAERIAGHSETVLITGETGTGKELIARTIHQISPRRVRPWVDINCAALPENLVESELFGYEKGAFSGADSSKPGLFELADKGTLFLDEIGELELHTQVKLLRVLDGQPFYRLGGHRKIKVDVRVIAATNQDLESAVNQGRFRHDLFHRLGQLQLRVPSLRERPEDIVALAEHFLRLKAPDKHFSPRAISALLSYGWPGNVRELRNLVGKLVMESSAPELDFNRLNAGGGGGAAAQRSVVSLPVSNLETMEEQMILRALERTGGHRALAAEQLGISRRTLSRKLKQYNIESAITESLGSQGIISAEQQKFFRARIQVPVTLRNARGEEAVVEGVNLSTGGMGLDGLREPLRFAGILELKFVLPDSEIQFHAKARLMWVGEEGRAGVRFTVIEPALFESLQHWCDKKMKEEGRELPG
jgi:DNA-binding NtrC family response regulator